MLADDDVVAYYERGEEQGRLSSQPTSRLEFVRTQEILRARLPPPPARVLDVGGGAGVHAQWLARDGYAVELLDPIALHVDQAREASEEQPEAPFSAELGDARRLDRADGSVDVVLLMGPLYHLPDSTDRATALAEARRVLRSGGMVAGAAISRFASTIDGVLRDFLSDTRFEEIWRRDLQTGMHRNPQRTANWFTTAYFHHPDELRDEFVAAGFEGVRVHAVEGFAGVLDDLSERLDDPTRLATLLDALGAVDQEPSLLGVSFHLLAIGRKSSR
jgi:ubiquinone/menaquinone biosynthesis C-methylase UbiE